ncbi:MAG: translation elongation factor Ts [bacterium]|nr:translation elongation factor Ts [bacterium]
MGVDTALIVELRKRTGVGFADCQRALEKSQGDLDKAVVVLREMGALKAAKKLAERTANQGVVAAYIHAGGRVGAMVEINCETDFVARNDEFKQFAYDLAMHVAAAAPAYLSPETVPAEAVAREREIYLVQVRQAGKPPELAEKIVSGKLQQFYRENCLLQQAYIKDDSRTVQQLLEAMVAKLGEKVVIGRFTRYQIG